MNQPKELTVPERLIVAADFNETNTRAAMKGVLILANKLQGTGVYLKVNSALRAWGYGLIDIIHGCGLKVFADLKLNDIPATLEIDGVLLNEYKPELLTVMCSTGVEGMSVLKAQLHDTEVLGVTVLTSLKEEDCEHVYHGRIEESVFRLAGLAWMSGIDGLITSPKEVEGLRGYLDPLMTINTPGIRPSWSVVPGDDQNPDRIMTPAKAIQAGATRIVIGRPITQHVNPREAVQRTLDEIREVLPFQILRPVQM